MTKKMLLAFLIVTLLGVGLLAWWLRPRDDGTLAEIQRRNVLRVGLDASFPPFETLTAEGQIVGLDVELAQAVAQELGVELALVNIGFDGLYDALLARRVDVVISGLPVDRRWTEDVAYSINYFNAGQALVAPRSSPLTGPEALVDQTVAVEWGSQADMEGRRLAKQQPALTLLRRSTAAEALKAVLAGEAAAAIVDGVSGRAAAAQNLHIVAYLTDEWYAAAVHIDSRDLLAVVNRTLTRLKESGQLAEIEARWLVEPQ